MGIRTGITGLTNAGKTTIFNALTQSKADTGSYPFCTVEPNHGVAAIPDGRLERIARHMPVGRIVPAFLELIDTAGLVRDASKGEGLGNRFLDRIENVDALIVVIRCFEAKNIMHVDGSVDALRECRVIETELLLKDLEKAERSITGIRKGAHADSGERDSGKIDLLERLVTDLRRGIAARRSVTEAEDRLLLADLHLLTMKPVLYLANVDDFDVSAFERRQAEAVRSFAGENGGGMCTIRGKIESEIVELPEGERPGYYAALGMTESGISSLARGLYDLLGLSSFFTIEEKALRSRSVTRGCTAAQAAASLYSELPEEFAGADVCRIEDLERYGSEERLRTCGKIRSEGRDYVIEEGDILLFRRSPGHTTSYRQEDDETLV